MEYTANLNLKKPEPTDPYDIQNENDNMDILDRAIAEAAASGHVIKDNDGTTAEARKNLQFKGSVVTDDELNNKTIVYPGILEYYMGVHNDWFAPILDDDGNPILTDDDNAILADWQYKYA
ncbi:MAG: hypothetical protein IJV16_08055 [Lachnospiraceae bacterium]|nr:hypothetical protein [Lachnospiraceae bacterium]